VHVQPDSLFAYSTITTAIRSSENSSENSSEHSSEHSGGFEAKTGTLTARSGTLHFSAVLENTGSTDASAEVQLVLIDPRSGQTVSTGSVATTVSKGGDTMVSASLACIDIMLWSISQPSLYTLQVSVSTATTSHAAVSQVVDTVNVTTGFRSLEYQANTGMYLNGENVKIRGFCDHNGAF
jgi:beta-galactosidase